MGSRICWENTWCLRGVLSEILGELHPPEPAQCPKMRSNPSLPKKWPQKFGPVAPCSCTKPGPKPYAGDRLLCERAWTHAVGLARAHGLWTAFKAGGCQADGGRSHRSLEKACSQSRGRQFEGVPPFVEGGEGERKGRSAGAQASALSCAATGTEHGQAKGGGSTASRGSSAKP